MQDGEAARFTLLDPLPPSGRAAPVDDEQLRALYAYPDPSARGATLRANAIVSLDGAATTAGTSGGLGGTGDRHLFALLRELADVIVVGAGTVRAENYAGARMSADQRQRRRDRGQSEVPPIAVVTRSGDLAPDLRVLTETDTPPLVLTCAEAVAGARARLGDAAEVVDCSGADPAAVDLAVAVGRLTEGDLTRVLAEGGPSLLGALLRPGLLDEVCLTTAPVLIGGSAVRIVSGADESPTAMRRAHTLADGAGYLYSRYVHDGRVRTRTTGGG